MTPEIDALVRGFKSLRVKDQSLLREMMRSGISSYAEVADFAATNLSSQAQAWLEEVLQQGQLQHVKSVLKMPISTAPSQEVVKAGHKLICPVCSYDHFWSRKTLMNTRGSTLVNLDWANRNAVNYICERCEYIFWFFE
jgi:hypothetical protein